MLFFVSPNGSVLVTTSKILSKKTTLTIPLLDQDLRFLIISSHFEPRPAMQIQGTTGGTSFLRVMGEDPPMLTINGLITGSTNCERVRLLNSAFHSGVDTFVQHSVIRNTSPIVYSMGTGSTYRDAYLVGMSIDAQESFSDVIQFSMTLISEPIVKIQSPSTFSGQAPAAAADAQAAASDRQLAQTREAFSDAPLSLVSNSSFSYRSTASSQTLITRPVAPNIGSFNSPLGSSERNSDGSLASAGVVRGIVSAAAAA